MNVIAKLALNARKQKEFRHMVRGRASGVTNVTAKRQADVFFLHKYAGLGVSKISKIVGLSKQRVSMIIKRDNQLNFTICHPKRSCMLTKGIQ